MTDVYEPDVSEPEILPETVVFPLLSGLNWPSYLLQAWRTLHALGVPEENIRLVPEVGHFAVPEISAQEPPGPAYDPSAGRIIVHRVDPAAVRPRLTVSVRAETVEHFLPGDTPGEERRESHLVGRLAHFLPPLLAGLPGRPPVEFPQTPIEDLAKQIGACYPELLATLAPNVREDLEAGADEALAVLAESDPERQALFAGNAAGRVEDVEARIVRRSAWRHMAAKLSQEVAGPDDAGRALLGQWADVFYGPAPAYPFWAEMAAEEVERQRFLLRALRTALFYETVRERERVVRELMEIVTTEAFLATAVIDSLCGIGWIHGRFSDQLFRDQAAVRPVGEPLDGWFLSVSGGWNSRSLMAEKLGGWAADSEVLGVGAHDLDMLDESEQRQLWALAAWRREAADPLVLLETAARRLIHPEVAVRPKPFATAPSRPGTLMAQPGRTAVLGGAALLLYPGVLLEIPLEDGAEADKARRTLAVLLRLFLPVACRVEVLWREAPARLDRPSYLRHEFQSGTRLGNGASEKADGPVSDPITL